MKLENILAKYDTDKNIHSYIPIYEKIFSQFSDVGMDFLEIGVLLGGTLLAWKDYFPMGDIYGIDIIDRRKPEYITDRVHFINEDITKYNFGGHWWNIIIDDASHLLEDIKFVVERYLPYLKPGGYLIIEDVQHPVRWIGEIWPMIPKGYVMDFKDGRHFKNHSEDFLIIIQRTDKDKLDI